MPRYFDIPGLIAFNGKLMRSARWGQDYGLKIKKVVMVATAATAAQMVPEILQTGERSVVFQ